MKMKLILSIALLSLMIFSCDTKATLEIKSNVRDAEVFVNEKSVGSTPINVSLEAGNTAIRLKKEGYTDYKSTVKLESGDRKALTANMKADASVTLEVNANVDDAEVFVNNKRFGKTPLNKKVAPGTVNVSVRKIGYINYDESVNSAANTAISIDAELITDLESIRARDEASFRNNDNGEFTDVRNGQTYKWIKIKNKIWMAENMNFPVDARSWPYRNDSTNRAKYGMLYSQRGAKEVANMNGWRVPTDAEWQELINANGDNSFASLKEGGSVGFDATYGGIFNYFAKYADKGSVGYYWSATRNDACQLCCISWIFDSKSKSVYQNPKSFISSGFSVRLVRDVR